MTGNEEWRDFSVDSFVWNTASKLNKRANYGIEQYGERFIGEPLEHLEDELLDALFYVYMLRKKLEGDNAVK